MSECEGKCWLPLEANPEVIQKYIGDMGGPQGLFLADVFSTEEWAVEMLPPPVFGYIFLYPVNKDEDAFAKKEWETQQANGTVVPPVWYTKQTIGNACGTIAILHALANLKGQAGPIVPGSWLDNFFRQAEGKTPEERAKLLEQDETIEKLHSSAERASAAEFVAEDGGEPEVDTHFIAILEVDGRVLEFDGRKEGVIDHGAVGEEGFAKQGVQVVAKFMQRQPEEGRFNIIALCGSEPEFD